MWQRGAENVIYSQIFTTLRGSVTFGDTCSVSMLQSMFEWTKALLCSQQITSVQHICLLGNTKGSFTISAAESQYLVQLCVSCWDSGVNVLDTVVCVLEYAIGVYWD